MSDERGSHSGEPLDRCKHGLLLHYTCDYCGYEGEGAAAERERIVKFLREVPAFSPRKLADIIEAGNHTGGSDGEP